jgi:hypothetical protein
MRIYLPDSVKVPMPTPTPTDVRVVEVYTPEGIFVVTDRGIFRQDTIGTAKARKWVSHGVTLLVDTNQYPLVRVHQLPLPYLSAHKSHQRLVTVTAQIQQRLKIMYKTVEGRLVDHWLETDETDVEMVTEDLAAILAKWAAVPAEREPLAKWAAVPA